MRDPCSLEKQPLLTLLEALYAIKNSVQSVVDIETVPLAKALGRVLAFPINSPMHSPHYRSSAMDGYAFDSTAQTETAFALQLAGIAYAGRPYTETLSKEQCVRIFTGAVVPDAVDSVVMQEKVQLQGEWVHFPAHTAFHQNIREIGEDISQGDRLVRGGKKLTAIDIGLLASVGISEVTVKRAVSIAIFSTGDELVPLGQPLALGQIHDSNHYLLHALLQDPCHQLIDGGIIADDVKQLEEHFLEAASQYDVIISTGGASVGDADYVKKILQQRGSIYFWKLAIKPGKPFAFGKLGNSYFFGLPGNPIAVIATLRQLVLPALQQLTGTSVTNPFRLSAICTCNLKKSAGRQDFQRGILTQDANGDFHVTSVGAQGSHLLFAMSRANCFIILPIECTGVSAGERVIVEPFALDIQQG
ncbi:MAG: gephyrin-like molybdotransferase Glp [Methylococcaceae bacterium]